MKNICVVTSTRAEYGSLKWLMKEIDAHPFFKMQLIVSGAHLMKEQGYTVDEIIADGFKIDRKVDGAIDTSSVCTIAEAMGRISMGMARAFEELCPDYVVVLGDRYELLPICNAAFVMRIPIIHIAGGDVTEGAIDNGIRNAITMLASFHFVSTNESQKNIIRMRGSSDKIWKVGALELDATNRESLMSRDELCDNLGLKDSSNWVLLTYHAETINTLDYNIEVTNNIIEVLSELSEIQVVATFSNADYGGSYINEVLQNVEKDNPEKFKVIPSLGHRRFLSFMKQASFVIGNSSSGITESPLFGVPSINIGDRQKGRYQCSNVIQCNGDYASIKNAITIALNRKGRGLDWDHWGDGNACKRMVEIFSRELL